ncbi:MAG TPA: helix-turn-helix domain-containing protein [Geodermatophilus sp.]|nr:helix-turn-helix domain-containing protein [Geodermatophilus sp.]
MTGGNDQLQDLVDTVAASTGAPATLEDRDLNLVASSGHDEVIDDVRRTSILRRRSSTDVQQLFGAFGIAQAEEPLRIPGDPRGGRLSRWCIPVRWRKVTYGYLWLLDPDEVVPAEAVRGLGDVVARVAASMALRARAADRTSWAVGELLAGDPGARARAVEELRRDGLLPPSGPVFVVAVASRGGGPVGPVNSWLLPRTVLTAPVGERAALVVPGTDGRKAEAIAERAGRSLVAQHPQRVAAGVSGPVAAHDGHLGWRQADAALSVALRADLEGHHDVTVQGWADLGVLRLLAVGDPAGLTATLTDERARRLLDGDPDLVLTARTYLDQAGSAQRTAAALAIHRQTLYHRLRRIADLTGFDLENGRDRLALHLVLTLAGVTR